METAAAFFRWSELDRTTFPEWRDRVALTRYAIRQGLIEP